MALSAEMQAKLDLAILAQNKRVSDNRDKSLSSVSARKLDFAVESDVNLFLEFSAGTSDIIDRDAVVKQPELFQTIYATVTGFHDSDKPSVVETDKKGKTFRKRVMYVDIAGGGATMMFFNAYDEDFPNGVTKGTVVTTKAIAFKAGSRVINKSEGNVYNLVTYSRDAWYAFNSFGHATSTQELQLATVAKQLKTVIAEIEL
jgi:hypothetical protein